MQSCNVHIIALHIFRIEECNIWFYQIFVHFIFNWINWSNIYMYNIFILHSVCVTYSLQQELKEMSAIKADIAAKFSESNGKIHVIIVVLFSDSALHF